MKKFKIIFFIVYGGFHIGLMIVALYADKIYANSNFNQLIDLGKKIPMAKWLAAFGCLLFLLNVVLFFIVQISHKSKLDALEKDRNLYKAKMFDMQETINKPAKEELSETGSEPDKAT